MASHDLIDAFLEYGHALSCIHRMCNAFALAILEDVEGLMAIGFLAFIPQYFHVTTQVAPLHRASNSRIKYFSPLVA